MVDCLEAWYVEYPLRTYHIFSNDDPGLTLTYIILGQILLHMLLFGKKERKFMDFAGTITACHLKAGGYSQLNE